RRRRGPDRPGLGRRHVRMLRLVTSRRSRDPRPPRGPRVDDRAVRRRARPRARLAAPGLVAVEARPRPLAAGLLPTCPVGARPAYRRTAPPRRARTPRGAARNRPGAAPRARPPPA